jgi:hypothetical protein
LLIRPQNIVYPNRLEVCRGKRDLDSINLRKVPKYLAI